MSFVARLRPELIRVAPPWRTFEETISGLVAVLAGERLLPAAAEGAAIQAVTAREAASSTALLDIHAGVTPAHVAYHDALTLRKVCRAGFCRPRHALRPYAPGATLAVRPRPETRSRVGSMSPRRRTRRAPARRARSRTVRRGDTSGHRPAAGRAARGPRRSGP